MNLERLHEILRETTIPVRKGPVRREEERAGLRVVHIDDMPAADDPALEGMEMVDVHFIEVAIDRNAAEHHKAELVEILREYPRLAAGPSYIEVGGEIGDQAPPCGCSDWARPWASGRSSRPSVSASKGRPRTSSPAVGSSWCRASRRSWARDAVPSEPHLPAARTTRGGRHGPAQSRRRGLLRPVSPNPRRRDVGPCAARQRSGQRFARMIGARRGGKRGRK